MCKSQTALFPFIGDAIENTHSHSHPYTNKVNPATSAICTRNTARSFPIFPHRINQLQYEINYKNKINKAKLKKKINKTEKNVFIPTMREIEVDEQQQKQKNERE